MDLTQWKTVTLTGGRRLLQLLAHIVARAHKNRLKATAGYLAYVTLMSLVPLVAVMFSVLSAFPVFQKIRDKIEAYVYSNFIPAAGDVIQQNLSEFVSNASKASVVGIAALMIFALLLISTIDKTLNEIWRSKEKRPVIISFSIYWMILTLGPVLLGASLAVSSYVMSLSFLNNETIGGLLEFILSWLPLLLSVFAFLIMYMLVPNVPVRFRHALAGAMVAAVLFETSKQGFALYITHFPSYQAIYGAMAAIPILLVWIYVSWVVVLIGAELTASLPEFFQAIETEQPGLLPVEGASEPRSVEPVVESTRERR